MTQRIHVTCLALLAFAVSISAHSEILLSANDGKTTLTDGKLTARADAVPDSVTIIRFENGKAVAIADIAVATSVLGPPFSVAITPDERTALVSAPDDLVSVLDLSAKPPRVAGTVAAGKGATGISITPDGKLALVANRMEGSVSVLAIEHGAVRKIDTLQIGNADSGLGHVAISPDGKLALASRTGDDTLSVLAIDGDKVTNTKRDFGVGMKPYGIAISRDASIAVVANVSQGRGDRDTLSVVDLRTSPIRTVDTVSVGQTPEGVALSPDGKWCAIAVLNGSNKSPTSPFYNPAGKVELFRIEGVKLTRVSELLTGAWPQGAAFASDSKTLFVGSMTERSIRIFRVSSEGTLLDTGQRIPLKGGNAALRTAEHMARSTLRTSRQFDTERLDFEVDGLRAMLLKPIRPAPGGARPWIFIAPVFMGPNPQRPELNPNLFHHPIADDTPVYPPADRPDRGTHHKLLKRLLESGFHIGGIEIGDTMGTPAGRAHFTAYYQTVVQRYGLDAKPCLFATSRGGLMVYNWAADDPERVRCIGANQPVIDLALFPGLERAADIYGLPMNEFLQSYRQHNPVDRLRPLADHKIPILHVVGGADTLLPLEPDMMGMQRRYREMGGEIQTLVHPATPHGLWPELLSDSRFYDFFTSERMWRDPR